MSRMLLPILSTLMLVLWPAGSRATPLEDLTRQLASSAPDVAYRALVGLGDEAVSPLRDTGCDSAAGPHRGRAVLALQEIGTPRAQAALRAIATCALEDDNPDLQRWAVLAVAELTSYPPTLAVLIEEHWDRRELVQALLERAVTLADEDHLVLGHWLVAPHGRTRWAEALADFRPRIVPVRDLARVMATGHDPVHQACAANVLLAMPPGHGVPSAILDAHRFDRAADALPWTHLPQVGRFDLSSDVARPLADELMAWLLVHGSAEGALADATWSFLAPEARALGRPTSKADWLHLWGATASVATMAARLPVAMLPAELDGAWQREVAFQDALSRDRLSGIADAAATPSPMLRARAFQRLTWARRGPRRRALASSYRELWSPLDATSGPRVYADVATILAEGGDMVRWKDVAPMGHKLIERYLRADRYDQWSAATAYEDGLIELQDAYDAGGTIPRCCQDGWLYWLGRVEGRGSVRARLRRLGMHQIPHFETLIAEQRR